MIAKVLLVDDEPDIRKIGQVSLKSVGRWETITAASGAEAIELASQHQPDVILLDMMMPQMDGLATLARLREQPALRETPVIFMTAKVQPSEVTRYLAAGAAGVIQKPFDPMRLPDEVRGIVAAARSGSTGGP